MNNNPQETERIEAEASEWWVEKDGGMSAVRARAFQSWCKRDPRHEAAFAKLEETRVVMEEMHLIRCELQPVIAFPSGKTNSTRAKDAYPSALRIAVGFAAVVAVAAIGWWQLLRETSNLSHFSTTSGGYERVVLSDGSIVELNSNTEVAVSFAKAERRVLLSNGEAHFIVAHDKSRPFVVSAKHISVKAVGTAFDVRIAPAGVEVLVTEGTVRLGGSSGRAASTVGPTENATQAEIGQPALLNANERLLIPERAAPSELVRILPKLVEKISPEAVRAALAWQERRLIFTDTPLREVVEQFNRRNSLKLVIDDPALAERRIGGNFAADNPEGFVQLFEEGRVFAVERHGDFEIVLRAAH